MATNLGSNFFQDYSVPKKIYEQEPKNNKRNNNSLAIITRNNLSKLNIVLISFVFILMAIEALIYSHSVQVAINANQLQSEITTIREKNYMLNVELAKAKELANVENNAVNKQKMRLAESNEIHYLMMPNLSIDKSYLITKLPVKERRLSSPIGY